MKYNNIHKSVFPVMIMLLNDYAVNKSIETIHYSEDLLKMGQWFACSANQRVFLFVNLDRLVTKSSIRV